MSVSSIGGYMGKVLRVDLTNEQVSVEPHDEATLRRYLGGTGLGVKYLYDEVPPSVQWNDPNNRIIMASGPLGATRMAGTGTFSLVTKGPQTGGVGATQANGYFGAFLKLSGFDGLVIQGAARRWVYIYIHDNTAEIRDASSLVGKDTWETEEAIGRELGLEEHNLSVFGIGPAGENLVKFAAVVGDRGHVAAHNGPGAVMGSKKLKAVAVVRGKQRVDVKDPDRLAPVAQEIVQIVKDSDPIQVYDWGTSMVYSVAEKAGWLPVKNYTTSIFPQHAPYMGENYRQRFELRRSPCWACPSHHLHMMKVTEGPYAGFVGEEPEYEQWAAWGSQIGQTDLVEAFMLSNQVDRLGMDTNEAGWVIGFVMECYEKGVLSKEDLNGLEPTWGNAEAVRELMRRIAYREGIGDLLAEGTKTAAERLGPKARQMAIYTGKGTSPRGHDHRTRWTELLDTCTSSLGTLDSGVPTYQAEVGAPAKFDILSPEEVVLVMAKIKGRMIFEDSLGICRFMCRSPLRPVTEALNAVTGWDFTVDEAVTVGRRVANLARVFNFLHGVTADTEYPSARYGSTPLDGPAQGIAIMPHWEQMRRRFYELLGWDRETGKPLPETLCQYGLDEAAKALWPSR